MALTKISPSGWSYYAKEIAADREDYYVEAALPSLWAGSGAKALGIHGETVTSDGLAALFGRGMNPLTGEPLGRSWNAHDDSRVAGYATTFSPPKSVSVLWATADDAVSVEVLAAHRIAVEESLRFLEEHAAFTRRGRGGLHQVDTEGFTAASFVHRTSRAADPQLHTHVLIANKVHARDGAWLSLDGREFFEHQKAAGMLYKAALRAELTRRVGVTWTAVDDNGIAEIEGVPSALAELWSKRRRDVEIAGRELIAQREATLGRSLSSSERAESLQIAAYRTRAPKVTGEESTEALRAHWQEESRAWGFAPTEWLGDVLGHEQAVLERTDEEFTRSVIARLEDIAATFGRADVAEVLSVIVSGTNARGIRQEVERLATLVLDDAAMLRLPAPLPGEPPASMLRADGMAAIERHGGARFTTKTTLSREATVLEVAARGRGGGAAVIEPLTAIRTLQQSIPGEDQRAAVLALVTAGDRVASLVEPAGAGKSTALGVVRAIYEQAGYTVIGLAPSAMAAEVLHSEAGIASETLAKFLLDLERENPRSQLSAHSVVILDEASMARTDDLARLVAAVEAADAKVILVGDPFQLGAVGPGGLFRTLVADHGAAELESVRRFANAWERAASLRLRAGDPMVLPVYLRHDRVSGGSREEMIDAAFQQWREQREQGRSVLLMAGDNETVDELSARCRATRVEDGAVERGGLRTSHGTIGVGDEVTTLLNDRRLVSDSGDWVRNGIRWSVTSRDEGGSLVLQSMEGHGSVRVPGSYATAQIGLAYALTVHKAQGATSDATILLVDGAMSAEQLYIGMTRGRAENRALVVCEVEGDGHSEATEQSPVEVLASVMRRSGSNRSAHDVMRAELNRFENRQLVSDLIEEAKRYIEHTAGTDRRAEIAALEGRLDLNGARERFAAAESHCRIATTQRERAEAAADAEQKGLRSRLPGRLGNEARREQDETRRRATAEEVAAERAAWSELAGARHELPRQGEMASDLVDLRTLDRQRGSWLIEHPEEPRWVGQLTERLVALDSEQRRTEHVRIRAEIESMPDHRLSIEARTSRKELATARSDIARLEADVDRRNTAIERLTTAHRGVQPLIEGNGHALKRIAALVERAEAVEARHVTAVEELGRRGIATAGGTEEGRSRPEALSARELLAEPEVEELSVPRPRGPVLGP
jgi:conjugative relaxase-like TrwC/TraI family protein